MNRISELRKSNKMTQEALAKRIGVSRSTLAMWETQKAEPSFDLLVTIADYFGTSVDYVLCRTDDPSSKNSLSVDDIKEKLSNYGVISISELKRKKVPVLGDIACGEPIYADELHGDYIICDVDADFALTCKGDSMIGARIHDGDLVFIRNQSEVENGSIAAVIINDEATLKRVYYYPEQQKLILNPENPAYAPLVFVGEELSDVRILGKAVAFQSRL